MAQMRDNPTLRAPEAIDQERLSSLISMVTHLQAEGAQVQKRKLDILELKSDAADAESVAQSFVEENKEKLQRVLNYLERTQAEQSEVAQQQDHLAHLLSLTKGELMYAYDELIAQLERRESIISDRLRESIEYFDEREKILLEGKDWTQERSDVANPWELKENHIEQIISVNQQVFDIYKYRNMTPEEKLHRLLRHELNPFVYGNFNDTTISYANSDLALDWKQMSLPSIFLRKSQQKG